MNLLLLSMLACFPDIQKEAAERFPENPTDDYDEDGFMDAEDCDDSNPEITVPQTYYLDADGDGFGSQTVSELACPSDKSDGYIPAQIRNGVDVFDCNDDDDSVNPDALEICDEMDNDCDGDLDEEDGERIYRWYLDVDQDGFGTYVDEDSVIYSCRDVPGLSANFLDCDDENADISPNADEQCDGVDNNCDTIIDESSAVDAIVWIQDGDGDGFGSNYVTQRSCSQPEGYVADTNGGDCNDNDANIHPDAMEACNTADDDCDGLVDEGADSTAPLGSSTFYADVDGDGFGDQNNTTTQCSVPSGYVNDDTDCNDGLASVYPNASETCNAVDDDCDGSIDESDAIDRTAYYQDADGDGFGNASVIDYACPINQPVGYVLDDTDCDDVLASIYPNAPETCNGLDDDCDGGTDEGTDFQAPTGSSTWYYDLDGDGFGDINNTVLACNALVSTVANADDCDDNRAASRPGAAEYCNQMDDDCDGSVDEEAIDQYPYYQDLDNDGHGDGSVQFMACPDYSTGLPNPPANSALVGDDCDDGNPNISPSAPEQCTPTIDENCDGDTTYDVDASNLLSWYPDSDGDGYGNPNFVIRLCEQPLNYVNNADDCNDTDFYVHPEDQSLHVGEFEDDGVTPYVHRERCNGKVDLCENDWNADLSPPVDEYDDDGDGFIECTIEPEFLFDADGVVNAWENGQAIFGGEDCDDGASDLNGDGLPDGLYIYPDAVELCNGKYDRCTDPNYSTNSAPDFELDDDGDGFVECEDFGTHPWEGSSAVTGGGDCNDALSVVKPRIHPDTQLLTCFGDINGDGYPDRSWDFCSSIQPTGDASYQFVGNENSADFGYQVTNAGDVDGDGMDDILIGEPDGNAYAGKAYLFLAASIQNSSGSLSTGQADYTFSGSGYYFGYSVSSAGDVDGDGLDDILIGSPAGSLLNIGHNVGNSYLFLGASLNSTSVLMDSMADYTFVGVSANDVSGVVASAGDVDGDGLDDILIGSADSDYQSSSGKSYLVLGSSLGTASEISLSNADYSFNAEWGGQSTGTSISSAGDVDGDGLSDILIGAPNIGKSYLILGSSLGNSLTVDLSASDYTFFGEQGSDESGRSVASAGDVDGDGLDDILIGAWRSDDGGNNQVGKAYLILGSSLGLISDFELSSADYIFVGEYADDTAGKSVSGAGDVDGDGLDDILIGAPNNDHAGDRDGKAYLILGGSLGMASEVNLSLADYAFFGNETSFDSMGESVSSAGDVDGDGLGDLLIGIPGYDSNNAINSGKAVIFSACE